MNNVAPSAVELLVLLIGGAALASLLIALKLRGDETETTQQLRHANGTPCWSGKYHRPDRPCRRPEPHQD